MAYSNTNLLAVNASTFETNSHAWVTAGVNTTLSVVTGQSLTGTYSLRATPTAAGSVELISPRWLVTAGLEYVARIPLRISAATPGRTATARITWFDAVSGGTSLGTLDSTLAVGTTGTWSAVNYPARVGMAPPGALSATLKLTVTGLAAGEYVNTDDVYAGAAMVHAGNLFGYNTASIEQDTSGWAVDSGSMIRGNWNLIAGMGFYALEVISAAAGSQEIRTSAFTAGTAGTEYTSYVAVRSPSVATTWFMELRWYDGSGVQVGTADQMPYTVPTDTTIQLGITGTMPTGATQVKVFVRPQATAGAQRFVVEDAQLYVSPNPAGNLLSYAEYSSEGVLPAWTVVNGAATLMYITTPSTDGMFAVRVVPTDPGVVSATLDRLVPVTAGVTYQVRAVTFRHSTDAAQAVISASRTRIDWYDAGGNLFLADNPDQFYESEQAATWYAQINSETRTCPDGAAFARVGWEATSANPLVDYYVTDNVSFMESTSEYTLAASDEMGSITLTVNYVPDASASTSNVTITRMDEDGSEASMRAYGRTWNLAPNPFSPIVVEDYEAPLGSRVWYSVSWTNSTGSVKGPRLLTQTTDAPTLADGDFVWLKSPGIPALNTQVMMEAPLKWARTSRSSRYDIVGRKNPVHVTGARSGRTSSVTVLVWDAAANALFDSLLDDGSPALVQALPGYGIEGNLYVSIGDAGVEPLSPDARAIGWRWTLDVTEVDRPDGGLQGSAASTWQDILDSPAYPTWEDLFRAHNTWADVLTEA